MLSRCAGWSRVTPGLGSVVCAGVPPFRDNLDQGLRVAYWVCWNCWWFQLMEVRVVGGRHRGSEQLQVAGVCEKAGAPVVIYTYRRDIV